MNQILNPYLEDFYLKRIARIHNNEILSHKSHEIPILLEITLMLLARGWENLKTFTVNECKAPQVV